MDGQKIMMFEPEQGLLHNGYKKVYLSKHASSCLMLMLDNEGKILTKEEIIEGCWGAEGVRVAETSVRQVITQLRRALESIDAQHDIIQTVPRRGYMLRCGYINQNVSESLLISESTFLDENNASSVHSAQQTDVTIAKGLPKNSTSLSFKIKAGLVLCSVILTTAIIYARISYPISTIDYLQFKTENYRIYYAQQGYKPTNEELATFRFYDSANAYDPRKYPYVYFNKTEYSGYIAAFLCNKPIDSKNSHCLSLQVIKRHHG